MMRVFVKTTFVILFSVTALFWIEGCKRKPDTAVLGQYFARCARFESTEDRFFVVDPNTSRAVPLDQLPRFLFRSADGQHTAQQLMDLYAEKSGKPFPPEVGLQVASTLNQFVAKKLIRLSPTPVALPYYLATPISEQDAEKAKEEMEKDGFGKQKL